MVGRACGESIQRNHYRDSVSIDRLQHEHQICAAGRNDGLSAGKRHDIALREKQSRGLFWNSAGGIEYQLLKEGSVVKEGRLKSNFRIISILWPLLRSFVGQWALNPATMLPDPTLCFSEID